MTAMRSARLLMTAKALLASATGAPPAVWPGEAFECSLKAPKGRDLAAAPLIKHRNVHRQWRKTPGVAIEAPMDLLDVRGASGTAYRFRRADLDQLPPGAGNLIAVAGRRPNLTYLYCATSHSLDRVADAARAAVGETRGVKILIRLNVARAVREAEHADIVAGVDPAQTLQD